MAQRLSLLVISYGACGDAWGAAQVSYEPTGAQGSRKTVAVLVLAQLPEHGTYLWHEARLTSILTAVDLNNSHPLLLLCAPNGVPCIKSLYLEPLPGV